LEALIARNLPGTEIRQSTPAEPASGRTRGHRLRTRRIPTWDHHFADVWPGLLHRHQWCRLRHRWLYDLRGGRRLPAPIRARSPVPRQPGEAWKALA